MLGAIGPARAQGDAERLARAAWPWLMRNTLRQITQPHALLRDESLRVPLPPSLQDTMRLLKSTGYAAHVELLVFALNSVAEGALRRTQDSLNALVRALAASALVPPVAEGVPDAYTQALSARTGPEVQQVLLAATRKEAEQHKLEQRYRPLVDRVATLGLNTHPSPDIERFVAESTARSLWTAMASLEWRLRQTPSLSRELWTAPEATTPKAAVKK